MKNAWRFSPTLLAAVIFPPRSKWSFPIRRSRVREEANSLFLLDKKKPYVHFATEQLHVLCADLSADNNVFSLSSSQAFRADDQNVDVRPPARPTPPQGRRRRRRVQRRLWRRRRPVHPAPVLRHRRHNPGLSLGGSTSEAEDEGALKHRSKVLLTGKQQTLLHIS